MPKARSKEQLGVRGEDLACAELERQGLQVLKRNWRCRLGESALPQSMGTLPQPRLPTWPLHDTPDRERSEWHRLAVGEAKLASDTCAICALASPC